MSCSICCGLHVPAFERSAQRMAACESAPRWDAEIWRSLLLRPAMCVPQAFWLHLAAVPQMRIGVQ